MYVDNIGITFNDKIWFLIFGTKWERAKIVQNASRRWVHFFLQVYKQPVHRSWKNFWGSEITCCLKNCIDYAFFHCFLFKFTKIIVS